ncbi:class A beta-lactamase-related serine hydrolase [Rhodococcus sp. ABRD24]|uniref:serine hydrolase domain-containing protein n=1 Tax=Rhodococcus sp. ABRD24 TaxID=2507582 RepID=UPI0010391F6A|nr:serine hydrolase domain-containing protein [Rhodococcus sp. ABRD24]QBJ98074.1 class A beta-lactamase-related serine hydrolase [Rhodococcus sp. ABRD24]
MKTDQAPPAVVPVSGAVRPPFEQVADVFARTVARQRGGGAALCIYQDGEAVVDLVGGAYETDSLQQVFSVSKGIVAIAAAIAHAEGLIDLDAPVAQYWPEFRRASTEKITARMILGHRAGLSAVADPLTLDDLLAGGLDAAVVRQEPYWEPGTAHGYAAFTFGALMNGVFTHAAGEDVASFVQRRVAGPLGAEFWFGAPTDQLARLVPVEFGEPVLTPAQAQGFSDPSFIPDGSFVEIHADIAGFFNNPAVVQAGWPAMSGVSSARDLARIFAAAIGDVDGTRLLDGAAVAQMTETQSIGPDRMLGYETHFGSGIELAHTHLPLLGDRSFGHQGAGGSLVCADAERGISMAFTTNLSPAVVGVSDQALLLLAALRHCLTHSA